MASIWNVTCDGCGSKTVIQSRYKCLQCANYDLCSVCYENMVESGSHLKTHPFQCLLYAAPRELFFAGEEIPKLYADSFTCPICGEMGHSYNELVDHVEFHHQEDKTPVICPLCIVAPSNEPGVIFRSCNIASHVLHVHGNPLFDADPDGEAYAYPAFGLGGYHTAHHHLARSIMELLGLTKKIKNAPLATPKTLSDICIKFICEHC